MKILLADDHKLVRAGLILVLRQMDASVEILEAGSGREAVAIGTATDDLDLVLMDLDLPEGSGLEAMCEINRLHPKLPVIILSAIEDQVVVARAMKMGARGFIPKTASGEVMVNSLQLVISGGVCLPIGYTDASHGEESLEIPNLTQRQMEVLKLMAKGSSNKEIARHLEISENTVRVHISAVINALDSTNRTEAAYSAMRLGIIPRVSTTFSRN